MAELSLSERLRIVSDPRPAEFNPDEEDWELLSGTRLSQSRTYDDQGTAFSSSVGRKGGVSSAGSNIRVAADETEPDPRYAGRPVSRRELFGATEDGELYVLCVCVREREREIRVCWFVLLLKSKAVKLANVCCCLAYS